ncbi:LOW QUALITY PROTEIN: little elongation complex subunit 1 [Vipera latastei]
MMPGETPPAANMAAIAAATACDNCGTLQQNLNEYIAALIALKQKIIDADHLLAEYQQKCNELQFAKRENSTLHHQVEQMFQKISPLKKCQEELGSVKAELEEKKSSLKIYQETHLEYVRVREEMDKSDSVKKKLEIKVKKLEEAAAKQTREFKQLKAEKKVLEKELKKAQEKIDGFPNTKQKKVLKNAETQSESENLVANVDKGKIKFLLEELWQCIESSTGKKQIKKCEHALETRGKSKRGQNPEKAKKSEGAWISVFSSEPSTVQTSPASLKIQVDKKNAGNSHPIENKFMETTKANNRDVSDEDRCLHGFAEADFATSNMELLSKEQEEFGESLQDVLKWISPLPPLLSPLQFSPATTPDTLFGDITDSSDDEMEQNAQTLENIIDKYDEDKPASKTLHLTEFCSQVLKKTHLQESHERSKKLENEASVLSSDSMLRASEYLNENNAKSKTEEKHLKEDSDFEQVHTASEIISPSTEKLSENMISKIETEGQIVIGHVLEETNDFIQKEEKKMLIETEDDWSQEPKGSEEQQTKELILTAEKTPVASKQTKDPSNDKEGRVMESVFEDLQTESYSGKASLLCEKHIEHITVKEQNATTERNNEPLIEGKKNDSNSEFLPETNLCERVQQPAAPVTCTESIEKNIDSSEPHSEAEIRNQQNGSEVNGKNEQALRSNSDIATLIEDLKQSYHGSKIIKAMNDSPRENVSDGASEGIKLKDLPKEGQLEWLLDEKKSIKSTQGELTCKSNTNKLPTQASTAEDSSLTSEGIIEASQVSLELHNVTENASQVGHVENANVTPKNMSTVERIGNSLNSNMEELNLRKRLTEINCEARKLTEMETIQSLKAGLCEKDSPSLMHGHSQIEKNSAMIINELPDTKKYAMEEKGLNYDFSASNEVASVQNMSSDTVQPMQNVSQRKNGEIESAFSVVKTGDSEANMESVDVALSSPDKENADYIDQHNSEENWKDKKSKTVESEGDKLWNLRDINCDYHNPSNKKDEIDFEQDRNHDTFNKPQALITIKSCSRENSEMLSSDTYCSNNINSADTSTENKLLLNHEELLILRDQSLDTRSRNDTVKNINEKTAKKADTVSSTEIKSRGIDEISMLENSVSVGNSSVSDSSEEEFHLLRKVNFTKTHPGCAVSRGIPCSTKNSEDSLPPSMTSSDDTRHEMFPVVKGEEFSKDRKAEIGDTGSSTNEVIEKTWEHSYASMWRCTNENTTLKIEASTAIEKLEENQAEGNASVITLLPSQDLYNKKAISGKSSVRDPDVNDDTVVLHTKYPNDRQVDSYLLVEKSIVELEWSVSTSESSSGRLPSSAPSNSVPSVPQENSVKILDSMYPELSARARTLNILKGNIQFNRSSSVDGKGSHQIGGFKAIASTSTAFVKTRIRFKSDPEKLLSNVNETGKRKLPSVTMPKSVKRPCLDSSSSSTLNPCSEDLSDGDLQCIPGGDSLDSGNATKSTADCNSESLLEMEKTVDPDMSVAILALEKISEACFDLLPVIRSRVLVGNTSKVPIMRDEEKEVVYELAVKKKSLAEPALLAILNKLKKQKASLGHNYIQSLCRVYVGICHQLGDLEKARLFCYTLLKEDFPRSDQLILFIANIWSEVFSSESVINKAIHLVARKRAKGDVLKCLKTYLSWEESAPADISMMISSLLWAIQLCPQMEFQLSEKYGEDLKENMWQYVFAIDLLCSYQKWCWTHDNIISKELWPIMDNWIKNRNGNGSSSSSSDIIIATVLRLIGRLGQIGLREGFFLAVENISSVIGIFLQHAKEKDVAWGVQLAATYALFDLGPSNPSKILEAIHAWKAVNPIGLPSAVLNGITEVNSLLTCRRTEECSLASCFQLKMEAAPLKEVSSKQERPLRDSRT